jgi:hypothetical protein
MQIGNRERKIYFTIYNTKVLSNNYGTSKLKISLHDHGRVRNKS